MAKVKGNIHFFEPNNKPDLQEQAFSATVQLIHPEIADRAQQVQDYLYELGQPKLAQGVAQAQAAAARERFTVAVAGGFSRGKSSFLNGLLEKEILPVGNLPTTAILTRIRWGKTEGITPLDCHGDAGKTLPPKQASWDKLIANHQGGPQPEGSAVVELSNPWLKQVGIELIDMPGAGDLDKGRAKVISEALLGTDAVIMTVAATAALSSSERLFIEQRLIAHKVPFLMLILTKLDLIPLKERCMVIQYVQQKLSQWKVDIPVFIPYSVELPDDQYQQIMGMDKIRSQLEAWARNPARKVLIERWFASRVIAQLEAARSGLQQQLTLMSTDETKRQELIKEKKDALRQADLDWEELQNKFLARSVECSRKMQELAVQYAENITEKLQAEVAMTGSPQKWWTEMYPYRMKVELTNLSTVLNKEASRTIAGDAAWLNHVIQNKFHVEIGGEKTAVSGNAPAKDLTGRRKLEFEDLSKERNVIRIGTAVLTIAGALVCAGLGVFPLVVTMGVGTGSSIVTEKVFKDKVEKQRQAIQEAIRVNVPELVRKATDESDKRLAKVYEDVFREAQQQKERWLDAQRTAIERTNRPADPEAECLLHSQLNQVDFFVKQFERFV